MTVRRSTIPSNYNSIQFGRTNENTGLTAVDGHVLYPLADVAEVHLLFVIAQVAIQYHLHHAAFLQHDVGSTGEQHAGQGQGLAFLMA